ncbi:MAG TPA: lanthionine synthetase C family protein, partial [Longimicrobium sp.]|nr:lanthionine synthetase C family protein [Longimicrobium sp.]
QVHYGFGEGASGIALFLLYLHVLTGRGDFRAHAVAGVEYDLAKRVEGELGWQWSRHEGDTIVYPYHVHGSAGIGSVLIRFHRWLGDERYRELAVRVAEDAFVKYAYMPGLFEGLAGIAELMLDVYRFTGEERFRAHAWDIAETILWFRMEREGGTAFPGGWLTRISNDYATGAAGIGLFLSRLLDGGPRLFLDLNLDGVRECVRE